MLTDEQIDAIWAAHEKLMWGVTTISPKVFARAIIAAAAPEIRRIERERCATVCISGFTDGVLDSGSAAWCAASIRSLPTKLELGARIYGRPEVNAMLASELERIANEPPVSGNDIAQARVLLAAAQLRRA